MKRSYKKIISAMLTFAVLVSNINLSSVTVLANDDFKFSYFGASTSEETNLAPIVNNDNTFSMSVLSGGGKINSSGEKRPDGMSYYYKELPSDKDFSLSTKVVLNSQMNVTKTQESFGLMLRDDVQTGLENYIALGFDPISKSGKFVILDAKGEKEGTVNKIDPFDEKAIFSTGSEFLLEIRKSADTYNFKVTDDEGKLYEFAKQYNSHFNDNVFAGFYVARDGVVTLKDYKVDIIDSVEKIEITNQPTKSNYLLNEKIDTTGLVVSCDGKKLQSNDYFISDFNTEKEGNFNYTVNYNGATTTVPYTVSNLKLSSMEVSYYPTKTEYFVGDTFDSTGLVINGVYNNGFSKEVLSPDEYTITVDGTKNNAFTSTGKKKVTVKSKTSSVNVPFYVNVYNATLESLELVEKPVKTEYFLNEEVSADGLVVSAHYSNKLNLTLKPTDYTITYPKTDKASTENIVVTYKNKKLLIPVTIKEKSVESLVVSNYPKTTFNLGENFDSNNLEISLKYDNGDLEKLDSKNYTIDSKSFDNKKVGTYDIFIKVTNEMYKNLKETSYKVTVREKPEFAFDFTQFGQSTSEKNNTMEFLSNKKDFILTAKNNAGKVTSDQDGISYYYTTLDSLKDNFVLSAKVKVTQYGKDNNTWDSQEFFGLMARDVNGVNNDASVFYSNMAAVGGFAKKTSETPAAHLMIRTGIDDATGANSEGLTTEVADSKRPLLEKEIYNLTLEKTNDGFSAKIDDNEKVNIKADNILSILSTDMKVGVAAARNASIEVYNLNLETSNAQTDAPATEKEVVATEPVFYLSSPSETSETDYNLVAYSNMNGKLTVKKGNETVVYEKAVTKDSKTFIETKLDKNANNSFTLIFTPSYSNDVLTSYDDIISQFNVENRIISQKSIYVSPKGVETNEGTKESPLDLQSAINFVQKGQEIIMLEGKYKQSQKVSVAQYNDGTKEKPKTLRADNNAKVVIDFNGVGDGFVLSGNYWHIKNIEFTNSRVNIKGFNVGGSNNTVELCKFYANGDTGLQISRTVLPELAQTIEEWPSNNLILNCESYDNHDPAENNADGFSNKLTSGYGNVFRGCVAHNNTDDGYDFFTKANSGKIGPVTVDNCVAYDNGTLTNGHQTKADSNGFKLGGEGIAVPHVIKNSLSFNNKGSGISSNSNPALIINNCIAFNNKRCNINYSSYTNAILDFKGENILSLYSDDFAFTKQSDVHPGVYNETTYFYDEKTDSSTNVNGETIDLSSFKKPIVPIIRDNNGNVIKDYFGVK